MLTIELQKISDNLETILLSGLSSDFLMDAKSSLRLLTPRSVTHDWVRLMLLTGTLGSAPLRLGLLSEKHEVSPCGLVPERRLPQPTALPRFFALEGELRVHILPLVKLQRYRFAMLAEIVLVEFLVQDVPEPLQFFVFLTQCGEFACH
jgi:hypothetical protein